MTCMHQGPPPKEWNCSLERDHDGPHVARTAFGRFTWPNDARAASPPDTPDELDRLHAAATAGEWYRDERGYTPGVIVTLAFDGSPTLDGRSILRGNTAWPAEARANEDFAMHTKNAWPSFSARLRAAEAVLRAIVACDDAISRGDEPPLSRAEVASAARAALGKP